MFARYDDFERTLSLMEELSRRMNRFTEVEREGEDVPAARTAWPRLNVFDANASLVVQADVPGMTDDDIKLTLNADSLTLAGERNNKGPEGYSTHRQERGAFKFSRTLTLPCAVDAEQATATVKEGVLTITLPKAAESRPRQIPIRGESKGEKKGGLS